MSFDLRKYLTSSEGQGNISYSGNNAAGGVANNGLSVTGGTIQLGGLLGAATAAQLLNNREIPMNGFGITFSGIAGVAGNQLIFKNATNSGLIPQFVFNSSTGAEIGRIRFDAQANG